MEKFKPNQLRHCQNLSQFTGRQGDKYYIKGIYQPKKEIRKKLGLPLSGTIYKFNKIKTHV